MSHFTISPFALARALEAFQKVSPTMQLSTLQVLIFVWQRGSTTQKAIEDELGMTNGSASRNVAYWTTRRADRSEGPGFIETYPDDFDRRFNHVRLTRKGEAFLQEVFGSRKAA